MNELDLLPGLRVNSSTIQECDTLRIQMDNLRGNPNIVGGMETWFNEYLQWVEKVDRLLSTYFGIGSWNDWLYSTHYWHVRELGPGAVRFTPLLQMVADRQLACFNRIIEHLKHLLLEEQHADRNELRVVLDTNVHLHYLPFNQVKDWSAIVGDAMGKVQLVVPLPVVRELDDKKNSANAKLSARAASRLRALRTALAGNGVGPIPVRDKVRLSIFVPRIQIDMSNMDEAILACIERLTLRPGGPVVLVTGDLSMQLRAESRDITVSVIPDCLRLPLSDARTPGKNSDE
ncbi:MAG: PIN domain-containing protein [Acidimicrobiales bacterium]